MNIKDFVSNFSNHPVLFVGAGLSLRYLKNAYTWDGLLKKISLFGKQNPTGYLRISMPWSMQLHLELFQSDERIVASTSRDLSLLL